jgi:nitrogen fixation protein FixH
MIAHASAATPITVAPPTFEPERSSVLARWRWPGIIIGFLVLNVCITAALITSAVSDPSYAIEPDSYQKALAWDATQAQMAANARLGWTAAGNVSSRQDCASLRVLNLKMQDRTDAPIVGANVTIEAFAQTRSAQRLRATLSENDPGEYGASLPFHRNGLWEIRLTAKRGEETFTTRLTLLVSPSPTADDGVAD